MKTIFKFVSIVTVITFSFSCSDGPQVVTTDTGTDTKKDIDVGKDVIDKPDVTKDVVQTECEPACEDETVCKTDTFTCVDCLTNTNCTDQICDTDGNTCVDCLDNSLCTEVGESKCTLGACGACEMDVDCGHLTDLPRCDAGTCKVECEDDTHCTGKVCDVTTNTCTAEDPLTATQCETCVSDSQCKDGFECVPLGFGGPVPTLRGNYCLQLSTVQTPCAPPYGTAINKMSLSSTSESEYCGIKEELATCEAVLVGTGTPVDCKKDGVNEGDDTKCVDDGAICRSPSAGVWRCTYSCNNGSQCSNSCEDQPNGFCK